MKKRETEKDKVKRRRKTTKEKEGETLKNKQKCPFWGEKTGFYSIKQQRKQRKETSPSKKKQTNIKKGGFRAKWGSPLGHLTWPLNAQKNKNKQKKIKKK